MERKYILVVNPIAGGQEKTALIASVTDYAVAAGIRLEIMETSGKKDEEKLLALCLAHKPTRVIVAGGDGTIKMVADALAAQQEIIIGIVPAGSANGLASSLHIPATLPEQLEVAFHNAYLAMDVVCINDKKSLHLSDIGLNAELIRNYENGTIRGKLGYVLQAINTMVDEEIPFVVKIEANNKVWETSAKMVVIANAKQYGTGVVINPEGLLDDGKFELVILKTFSLAVLGKIMLSDSPWNKEDVEIISTDKAYIYTDIPVHFQIDGEYYGETSKLDISVLPRCIRFAVPTTPAQQ